ncbi:MAG: hypothetical protein QME74_04445 [Candidatus Edwardsbacteria bacterium]|nr:hypothetical protein [Candidatus Edwardsbacteria bacterium]
MKRLKFLIEVPDKIVVLSGNSAQSKREITDTTPELIMKALILNDYHDNVFFEDKRIKVKRVEE